jgi:hypothetical protein
MNKKMKESVCGWFINEYATLGIKILKEVGKWHKNSDSGPT